MEDRGPDPGVHGDQGEGQPHWIQRVDRKAKVAAKGSVAENVIRQEIQDGEEGRRRFLNAEEASEWPLA